MLKDRFFTGLFSQIGLVPAHSNVNSSECGFTMVPEPSIGNGYLWTYPINPFCSVSIYHLHFINGMHYCYHHPAMLVISLSSPSVAKAVTDIDVEKKEQLLGYFLPEGEHEYSLPPSSSIDSISVSFLPEFYENRLPAIYERDFSDLPQIAAFMDGSINIPVVSTALKEIAAYTPVLGTSELFYEAKVLEIIAGLIEWHTKNSQTQAIKSIGDSDREVLHRLSHFLQQNYCDAVDVQMLARMCQMSKSKLSDLFHSIYGVTIVEFITNMRIEQAKELLANSSCQINEISSIVGYAQQSSFTYVFKKNTGLTPREYRKTVQRK